MLFLDLTKFDGILVILTKRKIYEVIKGIQVPRPIYCDAGNGVAAIADIRKVRVCLCVG
jgi:hypothetical protein